MTTKMTTKMITKMTTKMTRQYDCEQYYHRQND